MATEITTDLWVYQYGDTVTVTGIDFGPNETVEVVTTDPFATEVDRGQAQTDDVGGFTYRFVLLSDALGIYDVVATGLTSGLTAATQFDPAVFAIAANAPAAVQYSDHVTFSGTLTCTQTAGGSSCPTTQATMAGSSIEALVSFNPPGPPPLGYYVVASTVVASGDCTIRSTTTSIGLKATCNWSMSWQSGRTLGGAHSVAPGTLSMRFRATGGPTGLPAGSNSTTDDSRSVTINSEFTSTEYLGDLIAAEGTVLNLSADVEDLDGGIGIGNGAFSPDLNLDGVGVVQFDLLTDSGCSGSFLSGVSADIDLNGMTISSPTLDLTGIGPGTYYLITAYNGTRVGFYAPSDDCDQITIEATDSMAPTDASIVINEDDAWTNDPNVTVDVSANDDTGVAFYRLAESQLGLDSAADVDVNPDDPTFSAADVAFSLTGADAASKAVWLRVCDAAGNCTDAFDTIGLDQSAPTDITFAVGGIVEGESYDFSFVPAGPSSCSANYGISGYAGCVVSGGGATVGAQSFLATATDQADNVGYASLNYTVLAWTVSGFRPPVGMGGVINVAKGGSSVPLKFEVFAGATELTDISVVDTFVVQEIGCMSLDNLPVDPLEFVTTGGTSLRYNGTEGQFIQNWKTPTLSGRCFRVTMWTDDGSSLSALFMLT